MDPCDASLSSFPLNTVIKYLSYYQEEVRGKGTPLPDSLKDGKMGSNAPINVNRSFGTRKKELDHIRELLREAHNPHSLKEKS
jgi:hypothetical protein